MSSIFFILPGVRLRDLALAFIFGMVILFFAVFVENIVITFQIGVFRAYTRFGVIVGYYRY